MDVVVKWQWPWSGLFGSLTESGELVTEII